MHKIKNDIYSEYLSELEFLEREFDQDSWENTLKAIEIWENKITNNLDGNQKIRIARLRFYNKVDDFPF